MKKDGPTSGNWRKPSRLIIWPDSQNIQCSKQLIPSLSNDVVCVFCVCYCMCHILFALTYSDALATVVRCSISATRIVTRVHRALTLTVSPALLTLQHRCPQRRGGSNRRCAAAHVNTHAHAHTSTRKHARTHAQREKEREQEREEGRERGIGSAGEMYEERGKDEERMGQRVGVGGREGDR